jgi:uncharacterized membrane protein
MPHLSELHGAATHLAVVSIPLYAIVMLVRRIGVGGHHLVRAEHWIMGGALVGTALAGVTGLLVWGQAQTELRGQAFRIGTAHFWIGIAIALLVVLSAVARIRVLRRDGLRAHPVLLAGGVLAVVLVAAQGYLGGRMTYQHGVGVYEAGQYAQTAIGAKKLEVAIATHAPIVAAGREAFSADGLGCARCHGDQAQGRRGPRLAGGKSLADFRHVHAAGLFPPSVVTGRDFAAIDAYLKSLAPAGQS